MNGGFGGGGGLGTVAGGGGGFGGGGSVDGIAQVPGAGGGWWRLWAMSSATKKLAMASTIILVLQSSIHHLEGSVNSGHGKVTITLLSAPATIELDRGLVAHYPMDNNSKDVIGGMI